MSYFFLASTYGLLITDVLNLLYLFHNSQIFCPAYCPLFHFCLVWKSLAQRSLYALCPVCFVSTKDVLHFQGGSLKCHHVRSSQNFHLCSCANYYQFVYCFHHGSCILIILVLNSEFFHSNVSNLLELGSNTCSDSDFKLFCYCLPFSISHVYTNICNLSKIYFGKIY